MVNYCKVVDSERGIAIQRMISYRRQDRAGRIFPGSVGLALMLAHSAVEPYIGRPYVCPLTRGATEFVYHGRATSFRDNVLESKEGSYAESVP